MKPDVEHTHTPAGSRSNRVALGKKLGLRAGDALIVVDVQRDFLPGGALPVPEGDAVIAPLNAYLAAFAARGLPIFLTRDWHPPNHCSFHEQGGPWPMHCVQDTMGAAWPSELDIPPEARVISKATLPERDAYSGFDGTLLASLLRDLGVQRVFVGGLATDYCVRATVLDARKHGFTVVVLNDAIRGINRQADDTSAALRDMVAQGAILFSRSHRAGEGHGHAR